VFVLPMWCMSDDPPQAYTATRVLAFFSVQAIQELHPDPNASDDSPNIIVMWFFTLLNLVGCCVHTHTPRLSYPVPPSPSRVHPFHSAVTDSYPARVSSLHRVAACRGDVTVDFLQLF
jgi:hypothetical protein